MSLRVSSSSLISGALVCGNRGLGVIGSLIPSTGDNGPGYCYNDLSLPADNNKEICGRITTWPTLGTLTAYEDTSFEYSGLTDSFQYQLYVDGVATGSPVTVSLGVGDVTTSVNATTANAVGSIVSKSTCKTSVAATTANAVGNIASSNAGVCASAIAATTANSVGTIASSSVAGVSTAINATTANAVGSILSRSVASISGEITLSAQTIADLAEAIANAIYAHPSAITSQQIATFVWDETL